MEALERGTRKLLGCDRYVRYFDCKNGYIGIHMGKTSSNRML